MARRLCSRLPSLLRIAKTQLQIPASAPTSLYFSDITFRYPQSLGRSYPIFQAVRSYARDRRSSYDLFGGKIPKAKEFKKEWAKQMEDEEDHLWTASEDESDTERDDHSQLKKEIKKAKQRAKERSDRIDADDSDELRSVWSESDDEKNLWTGDEGDDEDDVPTEPFPNEKSDEYIDKLFEFEENLKCSQETEKGPDGRYINVWEVMSDLDVLIGAFENIISGPEYEELRQGGPKRLNMQFFKDIQARMRDPNYKFSPEIKLKPKSKLVLRKKWQKTQSRRFKGTKAIDVALKA
ncbi:hypothetical protein DH2020_040865 [Rehmannia glutinosa]|uniref:Uncharacterized protein n=1 Tax=Rehmannia glutinosa TaxID=99300 RepID=A0ABR0UTT1_REHGL